MPGESEFSELEGHCIEADEDFVPPPSPWADALSKVTWEDMKRYPDQMIAISLTGEGIIAGAHTLEGLAQAVHEARGENYEYAVGQGADSAVIAAVGKVSAQEIAKYPGQYVAISINPENPGILATAPSIPALKLAMSAKYGEHFNYAVRQAPQT